MVINVLWVQTLYEILCREKVQVILNLILLGLIVKMLST